MVASSCAGAWSSVADSIAAASEATFCDFRGMPPFLKSNGPTAETREPFPIPGRDTRRGVTVCRRAGAECGSCGFMSVILVNS